MISLKKLAADGLIKLTDARRKYTIDGVQRLEAIYRIPLKYLYYNNQNGRISTALQKYVSGHPEVVLNPALDDENPEYNDLFESFTKLDIENPIIRINTAFKGCSSLEKISVLPRIYHN